jgi:hypothetical protein
VVNKFFVVHEDGRPLIAYIDGGRDPHFGGLGELPTIFDSYGAARQNMRRLATDKDKNKMKIMELKALQAEPVTDKLYYAALVVDGRQATHSLEVLAKSEDEARVNILSRAEWNISLHHE